MLLWKVLLHEAVFLIMKKSNHVGDAQGPRAQGCLVAELQVPQQLCSELVQRRRQELQVGRPHMCI